jgi:hypothetical protein
MSNPALFAIASVVAESKPPLTSTTAFFLCDMELLTFGLQKPVQDLVAGGFDGDSQHETLVRDQCVTFSAQHPSLTLSEVEQSQARRVDKSNAGGVSHRSANRRKLRPGRPTQRRMCRPFRPESQCFCRPVVHATGRGCAGLPALVLCQDKKRGWR